jgi:hypothetical protein
MEASSGQTWDSNLYWSDTGPYAERASWMIHAGWTATATLPLGESGRWVSSLAVEPCWVLDEPREDHVRSTVKLKGKGGGEDWTWELEGTGRWVEGDDEPLVWTAPGGAPALGGHEIRDRRDQMTWTHQAALLRRAGPWRVRLLARGFLHDYQTRELASAGCQNYVDRSEWLGGFEIGHALRPDSGLDLGLGLRAGIQDQAELLNSPIAYDNTFFRPVVWASGSFAPGWTVEGEAGPDFRRFDDAAGPGGPGTRTDWVYQVQLVWNAGARDRVRVQARQLPLPSSGGRGMFLDGLWRAEWRHDWNPAWSTTLSFQAHENDFYPAARRDRVYSPGLEAAWSPVRGCELRAGYEWSGSESDVPHTPAREFERHRLSTRIRCTF